jgi:hypothetical protein
MWTRGGNTFFSHEGEEAEEDGKKWWRWNKKNNAGTDNSRSRYLETPLWPITYLWAHIVISHYEFLYVYGRIEMPETLCFLYTYHMEPLRIIYTFFSMYNKIPFQIYRRFTCILIMLCPYEGTVGAQMALLCCLSPGGRGGNVTMQCGRCYEQRPASIFRVYVAHSSQTSIKVKLSLCLISIMLWVHMGEWRYGSTILNLGTKWRWVVRFTPRPLYSRGNSPWYPLDKKLIGPQSRSGRCGVENISCPCLELNPGPPATSPSLYRLSYPN